MGKEIHQWQKKEADSIDMREVKPQKERDQEKSSVSSTSQSPGPVHQMLHILVMNFPFLLKTIKTQGEEK